LNTLEGWEKAKEHIFAYIRTIPWPKDGSAIAFHDPDQDKQKLDDLKNELVEKLGDHYHPYTTKRDGVSRILGFSRLNSTRNTSRLNHTLCVWKNGNRKYR